MQSFPPTVIWRHKKENLKKCSLRGLEARPDFRFFTYPREALSDVENYIVLSIDAPPLESKDRNHGLLVVDGTWRYAQIMMKVVNTIPSLIYRSIPGDYQTSYPRRQDDCPDPGRGLASIEAIYIAYEILGRDTSGLLDNYYWRECFTQSLLK